MKKTKIQKLRLHKQKFLIKSVAWLTILTFLITLLFMGFPIISYAASNKLSDYFYIKDFFTIDGCSSYYPLYDLSNLDKYASNDSYDYYDSIKYIFNNSSLDYTFNNSSKFAIFTSKEYSDKLVILSCNNLTFSINRSAGTYPILVGGTSSYYLFDINNNSLSSKYVLSNSTSYADLNVLDKFLCGNTQITYYNQNGQKVADNINYLIDDNLIGYGSGGFQVPEPETEPITYPDGSGGTVDNNMYLKTADWKFNIPKYWGNVTSVYPQSQYTSNWGQGNIYFYCLTNDFQKANASDFYLDFTFHIWISGHHFSDTDSSVNDNFYGSFNYDYVDIQLSNVTDGDNQVSFTISDIFSHAINVSGQSVNDFIISNDIKNYRAIDKWNWYISCTAVLRSQSANNDSGSIVEQYNFISQVSKETGNSITDNSNPFYPDDMNPDDYPFNDTNSTDYSSNGSNIVINNNPNFTNNNNNDSNISNVVNGDGNPFNLLIDKLFGDGTVQNGSIGGTTQNQLLGMTGASRWLAVANDAMAWIPASVWAELSLFLTICLGVLVVGFILRIILDFL